MFTLARLMLAAIACLLVGATWAFYVPGVNPRTFEKGDAVSLQVNSMTSIHTQTPKDYYSLPFCQPRGGPQQRSQNLGEFLTGSKIQSSPYPISMLNEVYCARLCRYTMDKRMADRLSLHIRNNYHNNWIIDNLPSASIGVSPYGELRAHYSGGFPIGFIESASLKEYVFNHVNIFVDYTTVDPDSERYRVVRFAVEPLSIHHEWEGEEEAWSANLETCTPGKHMDRSTIRRSQAVDVREAITYTYDVIWRFSDVPWASRWDIYLSEDMLVPAQVHWYSIVNSFAIVLVLSCVVVCILLRNLKADKADHKKNNTESAMSKWKLLHADVFRPPSNNTMIYCVLVGTGVQISATALVVICLSAVGFVSPARRGSLVMTMLIVYSLCGVLGGYCSSRFYKTFGGSDQIRCTIFTATLFPGSCFGVLCLFNVIHLCNSSTGAIPFGCSFSVVTLWGAVLTPSVLAGAHFGFQADSIGFPTAVGPVSRAIPPSTQKCCRPGVCMTMAGLLPFGALYVEMFFMMTGLWMYQFYYTFGFTLIVYLIVLITCAEITVLMVYYRLRSENHQWWWFSFFAGGNAAFYIFAYSCLWYRTLESSTIVSGLLYFVSMLLICFGVFLVTGSVSVLASLWFIRKLFGAVSQSDIDEAAVGLLGAADVAFSHQNVGVAQTAIPVI